MQYLTRRIRKNAWIGLPNEMRLSSDIKENAFYAGFAFCNLN